MEYLGLAPLRLTAALGIWVKVFVVSVLGVAQVHFGHRNPSGCWASRVLVTLERLIRQRTKFLLVLAPQPVSGPAIAATATAFGAEGGPMAARAWRQADHSPAPQVLLLEVTGLTWSPVLESRGEAHRVLAGSGRVPCVVTGASDATTGLAP